MEDVQLDMNVNDGLLKGTCVVCFEGIAIVDVFIRKETNEKEKKMNVTRFSCTSFYSFTNFFVFLCLLSYFGSHIYFICCLPFELLRLSRSFFVLILDLLLIKRLFM